MTGTAVARQDTAHLVIEGAGLNADTWQPARIAALNKLLPAKFQGSTENLIALASLVDRTGLDPFIKELYCWEDKGRVTYHVGRDGWLKIAKRDPDISSVASGVIHENDTFSFKRDPEGYINIFHEGGFPQGMLIGAWALVTPKEGPDQLVTRELSYYKHLLGKDNWRNYPAEMLETRVLATAIKFVSTLAAGLYAPGEAVDDDYVPRPAPGIVATQERSSELAQALKAKPEEIIEAEVVEEETAKATMPPSDPAEHWDCTYCGAVYDTPQGLSSHSRTHKAEKALVESWEKHGFKVDYDQPGGWTVSQDSTGEIVASAELFEDLVDGMEQLESIQPLAGGTEGSITEVLKAKAEAGPDCDQEWLDAVLGLNYPDMMKDGADRVRLADLTPEQRIEMVEKIRDTFGN
jgi:hypothetical protein